MIAKSNPVLLGALPDIRPAMSVNELRDEVQIGSLTPYIISVSVKGKVAADAAANANAVAKSYIRYIGSASNPGGQVSGAVASAGDKCYRVGPAKANRLFMHCWAR